MFSILSRPISRTRRRSPPERISDLGKGGRGHSCCLPVAYTSVPNFDPLSIVLPIYSSIDVRRGSRACSNGMDLPGTRVPAAADGA